MCDCEVERPVLAAKFRMFSMLLKNGVPEAAVAQKMRMKSFREHEIESFLHGSKPSINNVAKTATLGN